MAGKRLKQTKAPVPHVAAPDLNRPEHARVTEWNGLKRGDAVRVLREGRRSQWKYHYQFMSHVTAPDGTEYIDVLEIARGEHRGLWRSFSPEQVVKDETRAPRRQLVADA